MPDASTVLLHVLVVLVCAKVAAEVSERIHVPAVAGEIVAGLLIGPSVFGLVGGDAVLRILGELGVLLLLLDVGLQMNLRELTAVGRASTTVAVTGVALPFAGGYVTAAALGLHGHAPLFLGAALTATSVGVTARVFADLKALATIEARTVLGAAVADDVLGLVVLAVVVRVVEAGSVDALSVLGIAALAAAFLVVSCAVGVRVVPPLLHAVRGRARAPGTVLALTLAVALSFAELARLAGLAPIVGAFVAGICLAGTERADELRRDLLPLGHVFVPVFFLQIGIDADVRAFAHPRVVGLAAALLAVGVAGKVAAGAGLFGSRADRLLVGIGMIPRGEVGLIFAAVGLRSGVLDRETYGALLLVVLLSTLVAPPLLRWRLLHLQRDRAPAAPSSGPPPPGGWLTTDGEVVELVATPAAARLLPVALDAARLVAKHRPGERLLDWLAAHSDERVQWTPQATEAFVALLTEGSARSWRFLEATGLLDRALPELASTVRRRRADPTALDGALRWATVDGVRSLLDGGASVAHPARLLAAALTLDCADGAEAPPVAVARRLVRRLDLGAKAENEVAFLVGESGSLRAAAARADALTERVVVPLTEHLGDPERAAALYLLSRALGPLDEVEAARLEELHALVTAVLRTGSDRSAVETRRAAMLRRLDPEAAAAQRIRTAPRGYLLDTDPADAVADARLLASTPRGETGVAAGGVRLAVSLDDRPGALAEVTRVLAVLGLGVREAGAAVWPDGTALLTFRLDRAADPAAVRAGLDRGARRGGEDRDRARAPDATVTYDDEASPWYSLVTVEAPDAPGLLAAVAGAFAAAGADVHRVFATTDGGTAYDVFEVTDGTGRKLSQGQREAFETALRSGRTSRRRRPHQLITRRKHSGHRRETVAP
jgi:Kef-type K+ transport system membrane component KefB